MRGTIYTFRVLGTQVRLKGSEFGLAREIYGRAVYFRPPEVILEPGDIVVDLGANVGVFTAPASVVASRVISVEAQSGFMDQIYENAARNGARDRVEVEFGLIGAGAGAFSDGSVLHSATHFGAEPPILTMPDLMRRHALDHIDFVKVDIEGSEFALCRGKRVADQRRQDGHGSPPQVWRYRSSGDDSTRRRVPGRCIRLRPPCAARSAARDTVYPGSSPGTAHVGGIHMRSGGKAMGHVPGRG